MRKSDLKKNHKSFDAALARYHGFMNKIVNDQHVIASSQEKRDIAESVLIRLCANWEYFIDEHLVDCVNRDYSLLSDFFSVSIPPNPSWDLCHALIFGQGYLDFRSFGDLKGFSKKILPPKSNPFLAISSAHTAKIDEVYAIRNYLSHYSAKAKRALHRIYKTVYKMDRFLEPGQFVLAYGAQRLWKYFGAFEGASADMKDWY
ncbi:MAG: hypothetical protein A2Y65_03845 [Deltaproteobacteria bacterium RBG_13_52_11]|nr:MAG: hypothetical protein A2Y65_03845 [Deltaproteobacteria bacterium RBG_13_52_11]